LYFTISQERFPFSYDGTVSHPVDITRMYPVRKDSLLSIIVEANGPIQVNFIPND
jgi:hypothetical protein